MTETPQKPGLLVAGATGRLGHLLQQAWMADAGLPFSPIYAGRSAAADLTLPMQGPLTGLPPCDTVIALWGQTSNAPEIAEQNQHLALRTREVARAVGARRVVHLSSAAVYGAGLDLVENGPVNPLNPYGNSKLAMERSVAEFASDSARHTCLRLANVVGADSLRAALIGASPAKLTQYPDGHGPTRSYIAPGDLAAIFAALAGLPPVALPSILNIAAPDPIRMEDLLQAAGRPMTWTQVEASPSQHITLDTTRLQALLPHLALRRTAREMIADWQSHRGAA